MCGVCAVIVVLVWDDLEKLKGGCELSLNYALNKN
jgi:hypothetical protein